MDLSKIVAKNNDVRKILNSLVHNHDKDGNKCYTQDNTNNLGKPKCVNRPSAQEESTSSDVATHPPWNQGSTSRYVTRINRGLGHTKTAKGE